MSTDMTHEEYVAMQRRRVADLASRILACDIDVLDGSSQIARLRYEIDIESNDEDLTAFVLVESDTEALPIGAEALNWSKEALSRKEPELQEAREWALSVVSEACEKLIVRFSDEQAGDAGANRQS
jgi:hypothetical protein